MGGLTLTSESQFAIDGGGPAGSGTRYQLVRRLAVGGMAEIFLARAVGADRFAKTVVLKRLLPQLCEDDEYVAMFLHEARLCASLHHPNIAQVYDLGRAGPSYFFAMEYVHGKTVRQFLSAALKAGIQIPLDAVVSIAMSVASGLHYAHEKRAPDGRSLAIVHRDITPSNVLVRYDGGVKLVDFGIAKAANSELTTRAGTLKGKLSYMSPEQALGLKIDRRSDIFSLGILTYELATVSRLFRCEDEAATYRKLVEVNVEPPAAVRADFPAELSRIIMKMLARPPGGRYQTGEELASDLERFAVAERLAASPRSVARLARELFGEPPPEIEDAAETAEGIALWHDAPGKPLATGSRSVSADVVVADGGAATVEPARAVAPVAVAETPKPKRSRKRRRLVVLCLALLAVLAFDAYLWLGDGAGLSNKGALHRDAGVAPTHMADPVAVFDAMPDAAPTDAASPDASPDAAPDRQSRREKRRARRERRQKRRERLETERLETERLETQRGENDRDRPPPDEKPPADSASTDKEAEPPAVEADTPAPDDAKDESKTDVDTLFLPE